MIVNFKDKEVNVKEKLTLAEAGAFVKSVADNVASIEDGAYSPIFYDVALISSFLTFYTDMESPLLEDIFADLNTYQTFIDDVRYKDGFDCNQYQNLLCCIDKQIEFNKQQTLNPLGQLLSEINNIVKKMDGSIDMKQVATLLPKLANIDKLDEKAIVAAIVDSKKPVTRKKVK
jgi:hypothetical protein